MDSWEIAWYKLQIQSLENVSHLHIIAYYYRYYECISERFSQCISSLQQIREKLIV